MIAVDTSSLIAFFQGEDGADVEMLSDRLEQGDVVLPLVALTELLSEPKLSPATTAHLLALPRLDLLDDYWERAGRLRAKLVARRLRARLADTLIAQSCLDHRVALITRDSDFQAFARVGGLKLAG